MKTNVKSKSAPVYTHEGAKTVQISAEKQLRRSVLNCLLWEDSFYESGQSIAQRILDLTAAVDPFVTASLAIEAREVSHLRHVPLLLAVGLLKHGKGSLVSQTIGRVIQRPDEITELVSLYWTVGNNKKMLPAQLKKGLEIAFRKFNEYSLQKYNSDGNIKLRDALFLSHAKPQDSLQADLWKRLVNNELKTPDTWETELSAGKDKKETFTRLIKEDKLGYFALLRNLRNMEQSGVDSQLVRDAIVARKNGADKILPFRFIAAARVAPTFERELDESLLASIADLPKLNGETIVLVDISGSMDYPLSAKSDLKRMDAAAALASIINGNTRVFSFSDKLVACPPRKGMAGIEKILASQYHHGTYLGKSLNEVYAKYPKHDRIIVITDEQSHDSVPSPRTKNAYMINVASYQNGVGYTNGWNHISGFSENVIRWIYEVEKAGI